VNAVRPNRLGLPLMLLMLLAPVGCVRRSVHQKATEDLSAANQQGSMLAEELSRCKAEADVAKSLHQTCQTSLTFHESELNRLREITTDLATDLSDTTRAMNDAKARR